jgi:hypothetical protein
MQSSLPARKRRACSSEQSDDTPVVVSGRRKPIVIAYIDLPTRCWCRQPHAVPQAITNALQVGATVINLTFNNEADASSWAKKLTEMDELAKFDSSCAGAVISWCSKEDVESYRFEHIDPPPAESYRWDANGVLPMWSSPSIMLTFTERNSRSAEQPALKWSIITLALPTLPNRSRNRILEACHQAAIESDPDAILIGGNFHGNVFPLDRLALENVACKIASDMKVSANGHLHVVWWCDTRRGDLEDRLQERDGPYTLVFDHNPSSAETPAEPPAEPKAEPPKKVRLRLFKMISDI